MLGTVFNVNELLPVHVGGIVITGNSYISLASADPLVADAAIITSKFF